MKPAEELRELVMAHASQASFNLSPYWAAIHAEMTVCARDYDADAFLRWPPILKTMHMPPSPSHALWLAALRADPDWSGRFRRALVENDYGGPFRLSEAPEVSPQLVQHAHHLMTFNNVVKIDPLIHATVIEIGGGYGSMCRLFWNLGHRGKYIIHDAPLFSALQEHWLRNVSVPARRGIEAEYCALVSSADELAKARRRAASDGPILLLSTWGLSEIPLGERQPLLDAVEPYDSILLSAQCQFDGMNNGPEMDALVDALRPTHYVSVHPIPGAPFSGHVLGVHKDSARYQRPKIPL